MALQTRQKDECLARVRCYPVTATARRIRAPYSLTDDFARSFVPGQGDLISRQPDGSTPQYSYPPSANPTINDAWYLQSSYAAPPVGVSFVRFIHDGTMQNVVNPDDSVGAGKNEWAGLVLTPREVVLQARIGSNADDFPATSADQKWEEFALGDWVTVRSSRAPSMLSVHNRKLTGACRTVGNVVADRGLKWWVFAENFDPKGGEPCVFLTWPGGSLRGYRGQDWQLWKDDGADEYLLKTLTGCPFRPNGGYDEIERYYQSGVTCVRINGKGFWIAETTGDPNAAGAVRPTESGARKGRLYIAAYNLRVTVGVGHIKWSTPNGTPFSADVMRQHPRQTPAASHAAGVAAIRADIKGYYRNGATITTEVTSEGGGAGNPLAYTATLTAAPDGLISPFLAQVHLYDPPAWSNVTDAYLDIAPYIEEGAHFSLACPPSKCGTDASFTVDLYALQSDHPNWRDFVANDCLVEVSVRDRDSAGVLVNGWVNLFRGFLLPQSISGSTFNDAKLSVSAQGIMWLLQGDNARIDQRVPPMDLYIMQAAREAGADGFRFFCDDAVKVRLKEQLGQEYADNLGAYFGSAPAPLYSAQDDYGGLIPVQQALGGEGSGGAMPPTQGGLMFPSLFSQDMLSDIQVYAKAARAWFFEGYAVGDDRSGGWPRFLLGRQANLLRGKPRWRVASQNIGAGDIDRLIFQLQVGFKPERRFNRVLVASDCPGETRNAFLPPPRLAEAREEQFAPNSPNRASRTRERTRVVMSPLGWIPGVAELQASYIMQSAAGVDKMWPNLTVTGNARYAWGDGLTIAFPDNARGLREAVDGVTFRIETVEHVFGGKGMTRYRTNLGVRPLSAFELGGIAPGSGGTGNGPTVTSGDVGVGELLG